jgi:signal transduction histidine kinase
MRARLILVVGATSSLVLVAFLVPLALLLRSTAANRVLAAATVQAQALAPVVATNDEPTLRAAVGRANAAGSTVTTIFLPDGRVIGPDAARSAAVVRGSAGESTTVQVPGGREIVVAVAGLAGGTGVVRTFVADAQLQAGVARSWAVLGALGLALLALSTVVADLLARTLTRPLSDVARASRRLANGDLAARARTGGPPEVEQVSSGLNLLADRITELLAQERELVADLSHRLRTPLTALRIDVESLPDQPTRTRLLTDLEAVDRTVDAVIHDANRPVREGVTASCDATEVTAERIEFWAILAEEEDRRVHVDLPAVPVRVRLERTDLAACLDALIGNVFRHTPEGTDFAVTLRAQPDGGGRLVIADRGPGLPGGLVQLRGVSGTGSTGLGLDIATRTAERSGGSVRLGDNTAGGATVSVDLGPPVASAVRSHRRRGTDRREPA